MERDGWRRAGPAESTKKLAAMRNDTGWEHQPSGKHPLLRCFYRGYRDQQGRTFEFGLEGHPDVVDLTVDWATWDSIGQLVVARSGGIEKYRLSDLAKGKTTFSRCFEDLEPPDA
jgi:hypothetical protein